MPASRAEMRALRDTTRGYRPNQGPSHAAHSPLSMKPRYGAERRGLLLRWTESRAWAHPSHCHEEEYQSSLISELSYNRPAMDAALPDAPFRLPATPFESDLLAKYFRVLDDPIRLRILD